MDPETTNPDIFRAKWIVYFEITANLKQDYLSSKILRHHFYLPKVIIQVQTSLEYSAG